MLIENPDAELETDIFLTMKNALPKPDKDRKVSSALIFITLKLNLIILR